MGFKEYYECTLAFDKVFERYYARGYFGTINKEEIKESEKIWFDKFTKMLLEKHVEYMKYILGNYENKLSREYFTEITGIDVKYKSKEDINSILEKHFKG